MRIHPALRDEWFIDASRDVPLIVEHATGTPLYALVDGAPIPYARWRATRPTPPPSEPRPMSIRSRDGSFSGEILVS